MPMLRFDCCGAREQEEDVDQSRQFRAVVSWIDDGLFVSGEDGARDFGKLRELNITHIVNMAERACTSGSHARGIKYLTVDLLDDGVKEDLRPLFLPIIDIEHRGKGSDEAFLKNLRDFIAQVTKIYGKKPLLYTFHNFYNRHLAGEFKDYKWMIARYRDDEPTLDDGKDYVIWQYTSSGRIAGVDGNVDRSRLMGEYDLGDILLHH